MKKIQQGRYTKQFREETARLALEDGLSAGQAAQRLSLPESTLESLVRAAKGLGDANGSEILQQALSVRLSDRQSA